MAELGFFALTPLWVRLILLYLAIGWIYDAYTQRIAAGKSIPEAIGGAVVAGAIGPVKAVIGIIGLFKPKA